MTTLQSAAVLAVACGLAAWLGLAEAGAAPKAGARSAAADGLAGSIGRRGGAHVYVFRGFMGISPGLDELAAKLAARGVPTTFGGSAAQAAADYRSGQVRSIVAMGHSMGGAAALEFARELGRSGIPVQLVVTFDPVGAQSVPGNVRRVVNYWVPNGMGRAVDGASRGAVRNVAEHDPRIGHASIVLWRENEAANQVLAVTGGRSIRVRRQAPGRGVETPYPAFESGRIE